MNGDELESAVNMFIAAEQRVALTGAGISVASGIPDFRSPGGLWSIFPPDEFATVDVFLKFPERAWSFYRELGEMLVGRKPGRAHQALAVLESRAFLNGLVTQNIDGLHQAAGCSRVIEVHGNFRRLQCLSCGLSEPVVDHTLSPGPIPQCRVCGCCLKPDVVLFGESVRGMNEAETWIQGCEVLLVIGTSATVYPVADLPGQVKRRGGRVIEFNLVPTRITSSAEFFFQGDTESTVPEFVEAVLDQAKTL